MEFSPEQGEGHNQGCISVTGMDTKQEAGSMLPPIGLANEQLHNHPLPDAPPRSFSQGEKNNFVTNADEVKRKERDQTQ